MKLNKEYEKGKMYIRTVNKVTEEDYRIGVPHHFSFSHYHSLAPILSYPGGALCCIPEHQ